LRRLKPLQHVEIHIDSDDQAVVTCRVASVQGSVATLMRVTELSGDAADRFTPGVLAYLLFEHHGAMTALKGIATASPDEQVELAFVVIDGVNLPERRAAERVDLGAHARVWAAGAADSGEGIETAAVNVSAGGVLIERPAGLGEGQSFRLELLLENDPQPIHCKATIVRETLTHIALKFREIADADRIRLAGMIRQRALSAS